MVVEQATKGEIIGAGGAEVAPGNLAMESYVRRLIEKASHGLSAAIRVESGGEGPVWMPQGETLEMVRNVLKEAAVITTRRLEGHDGVLLNALDDLAKKNEGELGLLRVSSGRGLHFSAAVIDKMRGIIEKKGILLRGKGSVAALGEGLASLRADNLFLGLLAAGVVPADAGRNIAFNQNPVTVRYPHNSAEVTELVMSPELATSLAALVERKIIINRGLL